MSLRILFRLLAAMGVALSSSGPVRAETGLLVSAASSLTESFREVGRAFEIKNQAVRVRFNFAATGPLLQQIVQGAPADVFAAADQESMDRAEKGGLLLAGSRTDFAVNSLVLIAPSGMTQLKGLPDLRSRVVQRIAMGNPGSVPVGRYTKAALEKQGLWDALAPKYVMAISVKQAVEYVQRGEVEAGLVYASDAVVVKNRVRVVAEIPTATPIVYPAAVVAGSARQPEALAFVRFLQGREAREILKRYGFKQP